MSTPPGFKRADELFTRPRLSRIRRAGLLPAPRKINGVLCYSEEIIERYDEMLQRGQDRWMMLDHGRGRPRLADIGRLAHEVQI